MNLKKIELLCLAVLFLAVGFAAGFFTGRGSRSGLSVTVEEFDGMEKRYESSGDAVLSTGEGGVQDKEGLVNINTADAEELCTLPGIGEVIAERIIKYREEWGAFEYPEELLNVDGIGEKTYTGIAGLITCGR